MVRIRIACSRCYQYESICRFSSFDHWIMKVTCIYGGLCSLHYNNVIMGAIASQITRLTIVYSAVYSVADQRKHHSSASLAFELGIHQGSVNSLHKWPVSRKMFPSDDVIMRSTYYLLPLIRVGVNAIICNDVCNDCGLLGAVLARHLSLLLSYFHWKSHDFM